MTVGNALVNLLTGILYNEYKEYSDRGEAQKVANARMMEMIKNIGVYANPSVFSDPALSASLEKYYGKEQFNEYKVMAQGDPKTGKPGIADILAGIQVAGRRLDEAIPNQSAVRPLLGGPTEEDVRAGKIGYPPTQPPQRIEQLAPSAQAPMQAPMQAQQRPALQLFSISPSGPTLHAQYPDPQSAAVFVGHLNAYIAKYPDRPQDGLYYATIMTGKIPQNIGAILSSDPRFTPEFRKFMALNTYLEEAAKMVLNDEQVNPTKIVGQLAQRGVILGPEDIAEIQETAHQLLLADLANDPNVRSTIASEPEAQRLKGSPNDLERYITRRVDDTARSRLGLMPTPKAEPIKVSPEVEQYLSQQGIERPYTSQAVRVAEQALYERTTRRELEAGVGKVTAETEARERTQRAIAMEPFEFLVNEMLALSPKVNIAGGGLDRFLTGGYKTVEAWLQTDPDAAEFMDARKSFLANFARSFGEKGVLTEGDIIRAEKMLPTVWDSEEVAKRKMARLIRFLNYLASKGQVKGALTAEQATAKVETFFDRFSSEAMKETLSSKEAAHLTPEQRAAIMSGTTIGGLGAALKEGLQKMKGEQ